jgi:hypothetical protein
MPDAIQKLLSIGSAPLSSSRPEIPHDVLYGLGSLANYYLNMLCQKNGFYVFESALHVFSTQSTVAELDVITWNSPDLWISEYRGLADGCFFFAEDAFGGQFCIREQKIHQFDPETGSLDLMADDIEEWARIILNDYEVLTGYPLLHEWQKRHGPIQPGMRLVPKTPFIAGGAFSVDNLYPLDSVTSMRLRGSIATQIKTVPDGGKIRLKTTK